MKNENKFIYWKSEGKSNWIRIAAQSTKINQAIKSGARYSTIAQFTLDEDKNTNCYFAPLYFDFDSENIEDAFFDVKKLFDILENDYKYSIDTARIYLTGGRGLHVELPAATFGASNGDPNLPYIYKLIVERWNLNTLDLKVYNQKRGRMWRLPNLKRPNGKYKVPITLGEFHKMNTEELLALTNKPRLTFQFKDPKEFSESTLLKQEYEQQRDFFYQQLSMYKTNPINDKVLKEHFFEVLPACIKSILNVKNISNSSGANFNGIATLLATYYSQSGLKESALLEDSELFCDSNFQDSKHYNDFNSKQSHLASQFQYVKNNGDYSFSCGLTKDLLNKKIIKFDCRRCPIQKLEVNSNRILSKTSKAYELLTANDLLSLRIEKQDPIIEELVPNNAVITISGDTGVGKSLLVHALGAAVAVGLDNFLGFKISKPRKVLYLNYELNAQYIQERHVKLAKFVKKLFGNDQLFSSRFDNLLTNKISTETKLFESQWDKIEATLANADPTFDLVIVDNLYASTDEDEERNYHLKPLLGKIDQLRKEYKCSIILVTHHLKNQLDRNFIALRMIRGGSTLVNFSDVVLQMAKSNLVEGLRILKPTKERGGGNYEDIPIGVYLDTNTLWFKNTGVINDEMSHLSPPVKLEIQVALDAMDDAFTTTEFVEKVEEKCNKSERTAKGWLTKLTARKQLIHKGWGKYEKVDTSL